MTFREAVGDPAGAPARRPTRRPPRSRWIRAARRIALAAAVVAVASRSGLVDSVHQPSPLTPLSPLAAPLSPWTLAPSPAAAQPATTFEILLHTGFLNVVTTSLERPTVRIFAPGGGLKFARAAEGSRSAEGRWSVSLAPDGGAPVLVEPGDRVEVTLGAAVTGVEVPLITATADTEADTVSGRVLGPGLVYVLLHRDAALFEDELNPAAIVGTSDAGGRFEVDVSASFDLRPGTWGEVVIADAAGHLFAVPFAPPFARVNAGQYVAVVRADGPSRPTVALLDEHGVELSRGAPPIAYGNGAFLVVLSRSGDLAGAFQPRPGEQLAIVIDDTVVASEPITWQSATLDPGLREVRGHGPPGARLGVAVYPGGPGTDSAGTRFSRVGDDGRWQESFPALALRPVSQAAAELWTGGAFVHALTARVPFVQLELYSNTLSGVVEGRGDVEIVHTRAGTGPGSPTIRAFAYAPVTGEFEASLFDRGDEVAIGSGDTVEIRTETGETRALVVPEVAVEAIDGRRGLRGTVPPGAGVTAGLYPYELNLFGVYQFDRDNTMLEAVADGEGAFEVRCPAADTACGARYGYVTVRDGADGYQLRWIDGPAFGVAVTRANAMGFASAGARVRVEGDGLPDARTAHSRPQPLGRLPGWEIPLNDVHPEGLPLGSRYSITTDGDTRDLVIPRFEWSVDTRANTLSGSSDLALKPLFVIAYSNGDESRPAAGAGSVLVGADGRWTVRIEGFDLLPGDDVEMYIVDGDHFLQWHETGVTGPDEPTPRPPTATSTPAPTSEPTPEPTDGPVTAGEWRVYLARVVSRE